MKVTKLTPKFVEDIPETLEDGILYISLTSKVAVHNCCCGCKNKTVTPFSDGSWRIFETHDFITLEPSIGNYNFPCKSHYWIKNNFVLWL